MQTDPTTLHLSAIIPVTERYTNVAGIVLEYIEGLKAIGKPFELIVLLNGPMPSVRADLDALDTAGIDMRVITFARPFGESAALSVGFEQARGDILLTLPCYQQVRAVHIGRLVAGLDRHDMVVGYRKPRHDPAFNQFQSRVFSAVTNAIAGTKLHDAGCTVRAFKRSIPEEIHIYADLHRFLPMFAHRQGFRIGEVELEQALEDTNTRVYSLGLYLRRLLDLLTVYLLIRFTKKPFRFFGLIGTAIFATGAVTNLALVTERIFYSTPLIDRPLLLLGSLLMVLGIQVLATGLLGEIVIFSHAKDIKEYTVDSTVN